jgi:hypothetical protein
VQRNILRAVPIGLQRKHQTFTDAIIKSTEPIDIKLATRHLTIAWVCTHAIDHINGGASALCDVLDFRDFTSSVEEWMTQTLRSVVRLCYFHNLIDHRAPKMEFLPPSKTFPAYVTE